MLTKSLYAIPTWSRTAALISEHAALQEAIGGCPSVYALYRFAVKLREQKPLLDACVTRVTDALRAELPEYGIDVAIDASDLPAYANGQRYLTKNGPERERFSDPDASWGHRSAISTRKGGGFYGYKLSAPSAPARSFPSPGASRQPAPMSRAWPTICSAGSRNGLPLRPPRSTRATTWGRFTKPASGSASCR